MTQLVLGGVTLPEATRGTYQCYEEELRKDLTMASGRIVREVIGKVWRVEYSADYMGNDLCRQVLSVLRSGQPFDANILTDASDDPITTQMICTAMNAPVFAFDRNGVALWHNIKFSLREVSPHDIGESGTGSAIPAARGVSF